MRTPSLARAALCAWLKRSPDTNVDRMFRRPLARWLLMRSLARAFATVDQAGFEGTIGFELTDPSTLSVTTDRWYITIGGRRVRARRAEQEKPAVVFRASAASLARILTGEIDVTEPLTTGQAEISGRLLLASRVADMLAATPRWARTERPPSPG